MTMAAASSWPCGVFCVGVGVTTGGALVTTGGIAIGGWLTRTGGTTGEDLVGGVFCTRGTVVVGTGDGTAAGVGVFTVGLGT